MESSVKKVKKQLEFFCTDVSHVDDEIRLYGITEDGKRVCVRDVRKTFEPYFFALKSNYNIYQLDQATRETAGIGDQPCIKRIEEVDTMKPLLGYHENQVPMYKITMHSTKHLATARNILEDPKNKVPTYEGNILFNLRFMVDKRFGGMDWLEVLSYDTVVERKTTCELEYEMESHLHVVPQKTRMDINPHLTILYFDFEILKMGKGFGGYKVDPIIIVSCVIANANYEVSDRRVFYYIPPGTQVDPLPDKRVHLELFESEHSMLSRFIDYINEIDPDIFSGYNIDGYDFPYLFNRCDFLSLREKLGTISKDKNRPAKLKKKNFGSKATGKRIDYELQCEGRFSFDLIKFVKNPANRIKLRSYTLGSVLNNFLGKNKVEMPYREIPNYYRGTSAQRAHLAHYGWYDSEACNELMQHLACVVDYVETARVSGVPMKFLMTRGTQILTMSLLLRYARDRNFLVPSFTDSQNNEKTDGATVLTPHKGFHDDPVATLDFRSLYPSIMMANNICYSTKTSTKWAKQKGIKYQVPPFLDGSFCFVDEEIHKGLLYEMEEQLFALRDKAKADMKTAPTKELKQIYDRRQNAIKTRMNAIYGFLKANMVCDKDLMAAVTAYGRWMLETTKGIVEKNFANCVVIYGDTDSVFVKFIGRTLEEAFELGQQAAAMCTEFFNKERRESNKKEIHLLQPEKVFKPFLLISKKKYAGRKYMTLKSKPECAASGLENVRRDNAMIGSETQEHCLQMIVMEDDNKGERSVKYIHEQIKLLLLGKVPMHKLIITKNLSKTVEEYDQKGSTQIHVELAKRINARKDETGEQGYYVGDRIKYILKKGGKDDKVSQLAEDPLYALQNRIPIDFEYYIFNQMMKPLLKIMIPIICPSETYKKMDGAGKKEVDKTFTQIQKLKTYKVLFEGDHMRSIIQKSGEKKGILTWVQKTRACLLCGCNLGPQFKGDVCKHCDKEKAYQQFQDKMNDLEKEKTRCWDICRVCVGDKVESLECGNTDCHNFYQRQKVLIDIEDLASKRCEEQTSF